MAARQPVEAGERTEKWRADETPGRIRRVGGAEGLKTRAGWGRPGILSVYPNSRRQADTISTGGPGFWVSPLRDN